jgi:hypothetical protein
MFVESLLAHCSTVMLILSPRPCFYAFFCLLVNNYYYQCIFAVDNDNYKKDNILYYYNHDYYNDMHIYILYSIRYKYFTITPINYRSDG